MSFYKKEAFRYSSLIFLFLSNNNSRGYHYMRQLQALWQMLEVRGAG